MPQLDPILFFDQVESFIFMFFLLYFITCKYILPRTYAGLKVRNRILANLTIFQYSYIRNNLNNSYIIYTKKFYLKIKVNVEKYFKYKIFYIRYFSIIYLINFIYFLQKNFNYKADNLFKYYLLSIQKIILYTDNINLVKSILFKEYKADIYRSCIYLKPSSIYKDKIRFHSSKII